MSVIRDLCAGCKTFQEIVYTEEGTERPFCENCAVFQPPRSDQIALMMLTDPLSPWGPPFRPGDRVEARAGAVVYDGIGTVKAMSMSLEHHGTPVYPTFLVELDEKANPDVPDSFWYHEVCLTRIEKESSSSE